MLAVMGRRDVDELSRELRGYMEAVACLELDNDVLKMKLAGTWPV